VTMDASTVFVVALLVFAASLASYGLSMSPVFRGNRGLVITGFSVGAALLLGAVVLVVVSTQWWSTLRYTESGSTPRVIPKLTDTPFARTGESRDSQAENTFAIAEAASLAPIHDPARLDHFAAGAPQSRAKLTAASAMPSGRSSASEGAALDSSIRLISSPAVADPWSATRCVVAVQPDPAEPTRWWLENQCDMAVAILFSACAQSLANCSAPNSTSWKYPATTMLLPPKPQRSVTYAEQTQHGEHIRYVACTIATGNVATLVGHAREPRSVRAGLDDFIRANDECSARVERWADTGTRSGSSIDAILGSGLPGQIRSAR
jgi:hypothetical protein